MLCLGCSSQPSSRTNLQLQCYHNISKFWAPRLTTATQFWTEGEKIEANDILKHFIYYIYPICSFNTGEVEWHQECSISGVGAPNFGYRSVIFPAYLPYSVSSRYHKLITSQCQVLKDIYGKLEKFQSDNAVTRSSRHGISYVMLKLDVLQSRYHK